MMMSMNLGFSEMLFLFFLALLIFGPKKLPEIGRQIGRGLAEFKRASNEFRTQIEDEVRKLDLTEEGGDSISPPTRARSQAPGLGPGSEGVILPPESKARDA